MGDGSILDGVTRIGIWPGQDHEFRSTDWEVGFMHMPSGRRDTLVRVREADRDKAYAYYQELCEGKDDSHSIAYIESADGKSWQEGKHAETD